MNSRDGDLIPRAPFAAFSAPFAMPRIFEVSAPAAPETPLITPCTMFRPTEVKPEIIPRSAARARVPIERNSCTTAFMPEETADLIALRTEVNVDRIPFIALVTTVRAAFMPEVKAERIADRALVTIERAALSTEEKVDRIAFSTEETTARAAFIPEENADRIALRTETTIARAAFSTVEKVERIAFRIEETMLIAPVRIEPM